MKQVFYSREDYECALCIEEAPELYDFSFHLWAAKVISWTQNLFSVIRERLIRLRLRGNTTPNKTLLEQTITLIKNGVIIIEPIMLMAV